VKRRFALWLFLAWAAAFPAAAETMRGVVIVVIDGDTLLFKPEHYSSTSRAFLKIRLADIDAPEQDQPHGVDATQALKEMALKKHANLEIVATDVYGRKLGRLNIDALSVNAELVRRGHAWSSSRDPDAALRILQREASRARIGLWQGGDPVPPWVWRRSTRQK
jgi:endonuclease YncB( thermonuclease family)